MPVSKPQVNVRTSVSVSSTRRAVSTVDLADHSIPTTVPTSAVNKEWGIGIARHQQNVLTVAGTSISPAGGSATAEALSATMVGETGVVTVTPAVSEKLTVDLAGSTGVQTVVAATPESSATTFAGTTGQTSGQTAITENDVVTFNNSTGVQTPVAAVAEVTRIYAAGTESGDTGGGAGDEQETDITFANTSGNGDTTFTAFPSNTAQPSAASYDISGLSASSSTNNGFVTDPGKGIIQINLTGTLSGTVDVNNFVGEAFVYRTASDASPIRVTGTWSEFTDTRYRLNLDMVSRILLEDDDTIFTNANNSFVLITDGAVITSSEYVDFSSTPQQTLASLADSSFATISDMYLNSGYTQLVVEFNEPVDTFTPTSIIIADASSGGSTYTITGGTASTLISNIQTLTLSTADTTALTTLLGSTTDVWFTLTGSTDSDSGLAFDVADNQVLYTNASRTAFSTLAGALTTWSINLDDTHDSGTPVTGTFTTLSNAVSMAAQVRAGVNTRITAGTVTGLTVQTGSNAIVELDSTVVGTRDDIEVTLTGGANSTATGTPLTTVTGTDGGSGTATSFNITASSTHSPASVTSTVGDNISRVNFIAGIRTVFTTDTIGGFTVNAVQSGTATAAEATALGVSTGAAIHFFDVTSETAGAETPDLTASITVAGTDGDLSMTAIVQTQGDNASTTGDLTTYSVTIGGNNLTGNFTTASNATSQASQISAAIIANAATNALVTPTLSAGELTVTSKTAATDIANPAYTYTIGTTGTSQTATVPNIVHTDGRAAVGATIDNWSLTASGQTRTGDFTLSSNASSQASQVLAGLNQVLDINFSTTAAWPTVGGGEEHVATVGFISGVLKDDDADKTTLQLTTAGTTGIWLGTDPFVRVYNNKDNAVEAVDSWVTQINAVSYLPFVASKVTSTDRVTLRLIAKTINSFGTPVEGAENNDAYESITSTLAITGFTASVTTDVLTLTSTSTGQEADYSVTVTDYATSTAVTVNTDGADEGLSGTLDTWTMVARGETRTATFTTGSDTASQRTQIAAILVASPITGVTFSGTGSQFILTSQATGIETDYTFVVDDNGTADSPTLVKVDGAAEITSGTLDTWTLVARGVTRTGTFLSGSNSTSQRTQVGTVLTASPITTVVIGGTGSILTVTSDDSGQETDYTFVVDNNGTAGSPTLVKTDGTSGGSSGTITLTGGGIATSVVLTLTLATTRATLLTELNTAINNNAGVFTYLDGGGDLEFSSNLNQTYAEVAVVIANTTGDITITPSTKYLGYS